MQKPKSWKHYLFVEISEGKVETVMQTTLTELHIEDSVMSITAKTLKKVNITKEMFQM